MRSLRDDETGSSVVLSLLMSAGAMVLAVSLVVAANQALQASSSRAQTSEGRETAADALAQVEAALAEDPLLFLTEVLPQERPRLCPGSATSPVRNPGARWDVAVCGATWSYQPGGGSVTDEGESRVEVQPPSVTDPTLTIRAITVDRNSAVGLERRYGMYTASAFTAHADEPLQVDDLFRGSAPSGSDMVFYSAAQLDGSPLGTFTDSVFAAHNGGVTNGSTANGNLTYDPTPVGDQREINRFVEGTQRTGALRAAAVDLAAIGCPDAPVGVPVPPASSSTQGARIVCLDVGQTLLATNGTVVDIVDDPASTGEQIFAYLLRPQPATVNGIATVDIRVARTLPVHPDCRISCDLAALGSTGVAAGTHPGALAFWEPIDPANPETTFYAPASGIIAVTQDVYVGLCGAPAFHTAGPCANTDVGDANLTIVSGTSQVPADTYISGPLDTTGDGTLGLVSHGDIVIGSWAHPRSGTLTVDASAIALSLDNSRTAIYGTDTAADGYDPADTGDYDREDQTWRGGIRTMPAQPNVSASNTGNLLTWTGSIASQAVDLDFTMFNTVTLAADPATVATPPPHFPAFQPRWTIRSEQPLSGADICGTSICGDL